ncbi:hypothetical protein D3C87_1779350 [compost metagenome]
MVQWGGPIQVSPFWELGGVCSQDVAAVGTTPEVTLALPAINVRRSMDEPSVQAAGGRVARCGAALLKRIIGLKPAAALC